MKNKTIGFIGGGRITKIFLHGFKGAKVSFSRIIVFDPDVSSLLKLQNRFAQIECESVSVESAAGCDFVILAVHAPIMKEVLTKVKPFLKKEGIVVSLAPKITLKEIAEVLDGFYSIARVNPSAPGIINQGINPVAFASAMAINQKKSVFDLLQTLGKAKEVPESKLEAYVVISAIGSTYFWFQLEQLAALGVSYGMDEEEAKEVISEMMRGTLNTLFFSRLSSEEVMDLVPVKPLGEYEETIKSFYMKSLNAIYEKIKS